MLRICDGSVCLASLSSASPRVSSLKPERFLKPFGFVQKRVRTTRAAGNAPKKSILFPDRARILVEAVRAMPASGATAIAAFEVEFFSENLETLGREVIIFAFNEFIFLTLFLHFYKNRMFLLVSKYLVPKGFDGIAIFPFVILRHKAQTTDAAYVNHEKIHLRQQLELGILPFFIWYGIEFLWRLVQYRNYDKAYRNISFEREAYANEANFDYLPSRAWWKFLQYL